MILPIYLYGSEVLRQKAAPADLSEKEKITKLVSDMEETLAKSEGCGLAAPQVGESVRILIVDGTGMTDVYPYLADFKRVMINPVILEESEKKCEYSEGCLSLQTKTNPLAYSSILNALLHSARNVFLSMPQQLNPFPRFPPPTKQN